MKHLYVFFAFLPLALSAVSAVHAGHFHFGGCSDPFRHRFGYGPAVGCQPGYGPAVQVRPAYNPAPFYSSAPVYCGESFVAPAPVSTGYVTHSGTYAPAVSQPTPIQDNRQILCEPVTGYRVVMEAQFVTETVAQPAFETRTEKRYRTKTVYKSVPVTEERFRTKSIMVPSRKQKRRIHCLDSRTIHQDCRCDRIGPVWNEINETYTVKVPQIIDVPETYTVKVPVLRDEEFVYTVYVPQTETVTKLQNHYELGSSNEDQDRFASGTGL